MVGGGGGGEGTKAVKQEILVNFSKVQQKVTIFFQKSRLFWLKSEDKPNSRHWRPFQQKLCFYGKNRGFLDSFLGTKVTPVMCG